MQFKTRSNRMMVFKTIIGIIPDIVIASIASWYIQGGPLLVLFIFLGLQALYFTKWAIMAIINWSWFYISRRKYLSTILCDFLHKHKFPEPPDYEDSPKSYFATLVEDEELDPKLRILSAIELNSLSLTWELNQLQTHYMEIMAYEDAIEEYKRDFIRRAEKDDNN